jgi:hypothetical protein
MLLRKAINLNITFGNENNINKNLIGISYITIALTLYSYPDKSQPENPDLQEESKNHTKIETIDKLRQFGLSDEQIAEALDIPLEQVKQVDLEE